MDTHNVNDIVPFNNTVKFAAVLNNCLGYNYFATCSFQHGCHRKLFAILCLLINSF